MTISFGKAARRGRWLGAALALSMMGATAGALVAQTTDDDGVPQGGLNIPANPIIFGKFDPNVRKPTAVVNDSVITGTDVDQRVALVVAANNIPLDDTMRERLRQQILNQLIDETLQIQQAKTEDITVTAAEIDQGYVRVAQNFKRTPKEMNAYLTSVGSSPKSIRRQIEAELAWSRYLRRRVEPFINVGDTEVNAILDRIKASKGTEEFHLKEIYLAGPETEVDPKAREIMDQIKAQKQPFEYFARAYSNASTRAVGGDLDFVRAAQLPAALAQAAQEMQIGQIAGPIDVPGGASILYLVDKRQVGAADPRDALLSLRQLTIHFPAGATKEQASARAAEFAKQAQAIQGCGAATKVAQQIGADVVDNDQVRIRDLPAQLQSILLQMQVGQASPPFGSLTEGVRTLVLCGRDDPAAAALPSPDQVQGQLEQQRVNLRAQQMLRDLRRDAVIEYRQS